ncbi:hypothetical protein TRVA0_004S00848 [Trichomonascus vanleenenianus]|uniref:uncharacterized protein n=1 Tax=Trichomonascus vanleenenianus TaxID=2268995 RepID=UPI003EC9B497
MEKTICDNIDYIITQITSGHPSLDGIRTGIAQANEKIASFRLAECSTAITSRIDVLCKELRTCKANTGVIFMDIVELAATYGNDYWRFIHLADYWIRNKSLVDPARLSRLLSHTLESWEFCYLVCVIVDNCNPRLPAKTLKGTNADLQRQILDAIERCDNPTKCCFLCKIVIRMELKSYILSNYNEPLKRINRLRCGYSLMHRVLKCQKPSNAFLGTGYEGVDNIRGPSWLHYYDSTVYLWMKSRSSNKDVVAIGRQPVLLACVGLTVEFSVSDGILLQRSGSSTMAQTHWQFAFVSDAAKNTFCLLVDPNHSSNNSLSGSPLEASIIRSTSESSTDVTSPNNTTERTVPEFSQQVARVPDVRIITRIQQAKTTAIPVSSQREAEKRRERKTYSQANEALLQLSAPFSLVSPDESIELMGLGIHASPIPLPTTCAVDEDAVTISLEDAYFDNRSDLQLGMGAKDVPVLMLPRNVDEINRSVKYELLRKVDQFMADLTRVEVAVLAKKRVALNKLYELRRRFAKTHRVRK